MLNLKNRRYIANRLCPDIRGQDHLEAAAATAHETKHYLQKLTPETYHLGHEVEAYKVEGSIYPDALTNSLSDRVLYNYLRGLSGYSHVPGDPDWMRWQGTQLR
jgi:hypothetical protein